MSDEAVRQTRSQKRALERDSLRDRPVLRPRPDASTRTSNILNAGEVKATIKVEVQAKEEPVDMSTTKSEIKKEKRPPSPDDVIVLSDNEPSSPQMNGHFKELDTDLLMKSSPEERERIIKQLKEELRLEEAKLVLLKKLRQSQIHKETSVQKPLGSGSVATPPPLVRGSVSSKGAQPVVSGRSSGTVIPPPLVRGGQVSKHGSQNSQIIMPPLVRGGQTISVTPQQIASLRQQQQQYSGSGPPPLLLAPRASVPTVQGQKLIQPGLIRVANVANTNLLVNVSQVSANLSTTSGTSQGAVASANESPASRQAAAKLALRKQLEKTLLEIPPPKPPAPELNFLPSAANNEFIYLVGLEEVVQCLLDTLGRGKIGGALPAALAPTEPFTCTQCKTDFTCRWRKDKGGAVMCEQCMSTNQKKALKAEHTNRLKAAFVKALQQEQEIEQRILQQAASPVSHSPSSSSSHGVKAEQQVIVSQMKQRSSSSLQPQQHSRSTQPISRHHSSITQSPAQLSRSIQQSVGALRGVPHSFSPSSQLQNAVAAAALVSRPGKHAVRQGSKINSSSSSSSGGSRNQNPATSSNWRKQNSVTPGVTMAYVNPSLSVHKTSASAVERQREYLLDMIPSRSISQTANTWK
uniref:GATA-type domain-containing protein n=1 Tax=Pygocentrus nattereri TaxID=42514 RepID=A0A3B4D405_PYGNA